MCAIGCAIGSAFQVAKDGPLWWLVPLPRNRLGRDVVDTGGVPVDTFDVGEEAAFVLPVPVGRISGGGLAHDGEDTRVLSFDGKADGALWCWASAFRVNAVHVAVWWVDPHR